MRSLVLALALPLGPLAACGGGESGAGTPPNVLVLCLDTVRADRLGCYGGRGGLTPNLDAFAAGATLYERCTASSPWTVPSHASFFTGLDPFAHGAHSFLVEPGPGAAAVDNVYALEDEHRTLAEVLVEAGYRTGGVVANAVYLKAEFGLNQGFEQWRIARERAPRVNGEVLRWLDGLEGGRPWLLFVNYMDAHRPYNVEPAEGERVFGADEYSSDLLDALYDEVIVAGREGGELAARVEEQYDRAVRNLDRALGELFAALEERGLWDDTLVVVLSDHGEYFGEHRLVEHSKDVYQEALDVPLIVKYAGQRSGAVERARVSHVHVPRLVLEGLPDALRARWADAFPRLPGARPVIAESYYSRLRDVLHPDPAVTERFRRVRAALVDGPYKLIRSSDGRHELYDLEADPREQHDRAALEPARVEAMLAALDEARAGAPLDASGRTAVPLDAEHRADIDAMGYGGGSDDE